MSCFGDSTSKDIIYSTIQVKFGGTKTYFSTKWIIKRPKKLVNYGKLENGQHKLYISNNL